MDLAPGLDASDTIVYVLNAVKAGMEWIQNEVIAQIISLLASVGNLIIETITRTVAEIFAFTYQKIGDRSILNINGNTLEIQIASSNQDLSISLNEIDLKISDLFFDVGIETLSPYGGLIASMATQAVALPIFGYVKTQTPINFPTASLIFSGSILLSIITEIIASQLLSGDDRTKFHQMNSIFHLGLGLGGLAWIFKGNLGSVNMVQMWNVHDGMLTIPASRGPSNLIKPLIGLIGLGVLVSGAKNVNNFFFSSVKINVFQMILPLISGVGIGYAQNHFLASRIPFAPELGEYMEIYEYAFNEILGISTLPSDPTESGDLTQRSSGPLQDIKEAEKGYEQKRTSDLKNGLILAYINSIYHIIASLVFAFIGSN